MKDDTFAGAKGFSLCCQKGVPRSAPVLRAGDDFVGGSGEAEGDAAILIGFEGCGQIELGERDLFRPIAGGPVVAASVDHSGDDGVVSRFFVVAVAEDERRGRRLGLGGRDRVGTLGVGGLLLVGDVVRLSGARVVRSNRTAANVTVALPFDQQRVGGFMLLDRSACALSSSGWSLENDDRR